MKSSSRARYEQKATNCMTGVYDNFFGKKGDKVKTKKRDMISVNLTKENVLFLQNIGFLDRWKRATSKNLSEFMNKCVDSFRGVNHPSQVRELTEKLLVIDINILQKRRNALDDEIVQIGNKLEDLRKRDKKF